MTIRPDSIKTNSFAPPLSKTASNPFNADSVTGSVRTETADCSKEAIEKKKRVRISHTAGTDFLTTRELAERWPVSIRTLENWRAREFGPEWHKFGVKVAYHIDDVKAYEATHYPKLRTS